MGRDICQRGHAMGSFVPRLRAMPKLKFPIPVQLFFVEETPWSNKTPQRVIVCVRSTRKSTKLVQCLRRWTVLLTGLAKDSTRWLVTSSETTRRRCVTTTEVLRACVCVIASAIGYVLSLVCVVGSVLSDPPLVTLSSRRVL